LPCDRYQHLQAKPERSRHPNEIAWLQGFEQGWEDATQLRLNDGDNSAGPIRTLELLRKQLAELPAATTTADRLCAEALSVIARVIRHCEDDSTAWGEAA
jgi:hypothetical protein